MRFIESILLKDGVYHNLDLHQQRLNQTFDRFKPEIKSHDLRKILPKIDLDGTYKVRVVYDSDSEDADYDLEYAEYIPRVIESLDLVRSEPFDYSFKFEDRQHIHTLVKNSNADDIIIAIDDNVTDSSYANLVFWDGSKWITPDAPLLAGVRRSQLIREDKIEERSIQVSHLNSFEKVSLINAMLDLGELIIYMENVKF